MNILNILPYPIRAIIRAGRAVMIECKNKRIQEKEWRSMTMTITFSINGKSFRQCICRKEFKNLHPFMTYKSACAYLLSGDK